MKTGQLTIQNYKAYSKEDQKTWSSLFEEQIGSLDLEEKGVKTYLERLAKLKLKKGEIPNIENLNKILKPLSGFELVSVTGELEPNIKFQILKNRKFAVTITLPAMFDEVVGRVPFLLNKAYGDELVSIAINATANPSMYDEYAAQYDATLLELKKLNETNSTPAKVN